MSLSGYNFPLHSGEIEALHIAARKAWDDDTRLPCFEGHPERSVGQCLVTAYWLSQRMGGHVARNSGHYFWLTPDKLAALDLCGGHTGDTPIFTPAGEFEIVQVRRHKRAQRFAKRADRYFEHLGASDWDREYLDYLAQATGGKWYPNVNGIPMLTTEQGTAYLHPSTYDPYGKNMVSLNGIEVEPKGNGLGTTLINHSRDYADQSGRPFQVSMIGNRSYFNTTRFPWLEENNANLRYTPRTASSRIALDLAGDAYPAEEPQAVEDMNQRHLHDTPTSDPLNGEYQFIYCDGQIEVSPYHSHEDLLDHVGVDSAHKGPLAAGTVSLQDGVAFWQVTGNINPHALKRVFADYTKEAGWSFGGLTQVDGSPIDDEAFGGDRTGRCYFAYGESGDLSIVQRWGRLSELEGSRITGYIDIRNKCAKVHTLSLPTYFLSMRHVAKNDMTHMGEALLDWCEDNNLKLLAANDNVVKTIEDLQEHNLYDPNPKSDDEHQYPAHEEDWGDPSCPCAHCRSKYPDMLSVEPEQHSGFPELADPDNPSPSNRFEEQFPYTSYVRRSAVDGFDLPAHQKGDHYFVALRHRGPNAVLQIRQGKIVALAGSVHDQNCLLLKQAWSPPKMEAPDLAGPIPFIYDIQDDAITTGQPGTRTSDIPGKFTPGGIVDGVYDPSGKVIINTFTNMPWSTYHMLQLWYAQYPMLEVKSVHLQDDAGGDTRLAGAWGENFEECEKCHGTGQAMITCPTCRGNGVVSSPAQMSLLPNDQSSQYVMCPECHGAKQIAGACDECNGTGRGDLAFSQAQQFFPGVHLRGEQAPYDSKPCDMCQGYGKVEGRGNTVLCPKCHGDCYVTNFWDNNPRFSHKGDYMYPDGKTWHRDYAYPEQSGALDTYQGEDYEHINGALRGHNGSDHYHSLLPHMDSAMQEHPRLENETTLYRGTSGSGVDGLLDQLGRDTSQWVGKTFIDHGFSSCAVASNSAASWAHPYLFIIDCPPGTPGVLMPNEHYKENEWVLPRGAQFFVTKVDEDEDPADAVPDVTPERPIENYRQAGPINDWLDSSHRTRGKRVIPIWVKLIGFSPSTGTKNWERDNYDDRYPEDEEDDWPAEDREPNYAKVAGWNKAIQSFGMIPGDEELLGGDIRNIEPNPNRGVNPSYYGEITRNNGQDLHPVVVKPVGSYHNNDLAHERAAFAVAHAMGINAPHTVARDLGRYGANHQYGPSQIQERIPGETAGRKGYYNSRQFLEAYPEARHIALLDSVIGNDDRHLNNVLVGDDGKPYPIDHGGAFNTYYSPYGLNSATRGMPLTPEEQEMLKRASQVDVRQFGVSDAGHHAMQARIEHMLGLGEHPYDFPSVYDPHPDIERPTTPSDSYYETWPPPASSPSYTPLPPNPLW